VKTTYAHKSYGLGFKVTIRPEDRRYAKRMMHDGSLRLVDVGPIPHGLTFFDLMAQIAWRAHEALERITYTQLFDTSFTKT